MNYHGYMLFGCVLLVLFFGFLATDQPFSAVLTLLYSGICFIAGDEQRKEDLDKKELKRKEDNFHLCDY